MKSTLILCCLLLLSSIANAQTFKIGVSGTRNTPVILESPPFEGMEIVDRQYSYQVEAHLLQKIYNDHSISLGFVYTPNRFDFSKSPFRVSKTLTSYSIPILLNFHLCKNLTFEIGGQVNLNKIEPPRTQSLKVHDSSVRGGLSYRFDFGVYIFSYYNYAVTPVNIGINTYGFNSISLGTGFSF